MSHSAGFTSTLHPCPLFTLSPQGQVGRQAHGPTYISLIMSSFCTFFFAATHFYHAESNFVIMTSTNRLPSVGCVFVTLFITFAGQLIIIFLHDISRPTVLIKVGRKMTHRVARIHVRRDIVGSWDIFFAQKTAIDGDDDECWSCGVGGRQCEGHEKMKWRE